MVGVLHASLAGRGGLHRCGGGKKHPGVRQQAQTDSRVARPVLDFCRLQVPLTSPSVAATAISEHQQRQYHSAVALRHDNIPSLPSCWCRDVWCELQITKKPDPAKIKPAKTHIHSLYCITFSELFQ